jgi:hypothetical protein
MKIPGNADRVRVAAARVEGCSIRATVRMTGIAKNTIIQLPEGLAAVCANYNDRDLRNVKINSIQCDYI